MGDRPDSKNELTAFLTRFTAPVVGIISLATTLLTFIRIFNDPKDAGMLLVILLVLGVLSLLGVCLYYARFWKPEFADKSSSAFAPAPTDQQVKAQAKKVKQRQWLRCSAVAGLVLIPLISLGGFWYWQHLQNQPSKDILILVADFESTVDKDYFVTKLIFENLETATEPYPDVKVKRLNRIIQEKKDARDEGDEQKASIVIWGSYGKTKEMVPISANFELLKRPDYFPELSPETKGKVRAVALSDLESLKLQTNLSQEMAYLTLVTLGMSRYAAEDWKGAIASFTDALNQSKKPPYVLVQSKIFFARGFSYQKQENSDQAIADYTQAINLEANNHYNYVQRGLVYQFKENFDQAIADYTKAIELQPDYFLAYYARGNACSDQKQYEKAIVNYTQVIKLKPDYVYAYFDRGRVYSNLKNFDQAIADYTQVIKLNPKDAYAYRNRGYAYLQKKEFDQAITDYTQAIRLDPKDANAYSNRGYAFSEKKKFDQAIADYTQAIKLDLKHADAYNGRGITYGEKKEFAQALNDLNQALRLEPDGGHIYDSRGTVYRYMRKYDQSLKDYTQAIKLDPINQDVSYSWRGVIYLEQGNKQSAIKDFQKVIELTENPEFKQRAAQELKKLGVRSER